MHALGSMELSPSYEETAAPTSVAQRRPSYCAGYARQMQTISKLWESQNDLLSWPSCVHAVLDPYLESDPQTTHVGSFHAADLLVQFQV